MKTTSMLALCGLAFLALLAVVLLSMTASAVTSYYNWTGTSDHHTWEDIDNWDRGGNYPNATNASVTFKTGCADSVATHGPITIGKQTVQGGTTMYLTLGGNLTVSDDGGLDGYIDWSSPNFFNCSGHSLLTDGNLRLYAGTFNAGNAYHQLGWSGQGGTYGLIMEGGIFNGGTGDQNISSICLSSASGGCYLTSGKTIFSCGASGIIFGLDGHQSIIHPGTGTCEFILSAAAERYLHSSSKAPLHFNNLIMNKTGGELMFFNANGFPIIVDGNFTLTAGTLTLSEKTSGGSYYFVVEGTTTITGILKTQTARCVFNGTVTVANGATLGTNTAWTGLFNSSVINHGTIHLGTGSKTIGANAYISNSADGAVNVNGGYINGTSATTSLLVNAGTWTWATVGLNLLNVRFAAVTTGGSTRTFTVGQCIFVNTTVVITAGDTFSVTAWVAMLNTTFTPGDFDIGAAGLLLEQNWSTSAVVVVGAVATVNVTNTSYSTWTPSYNSWGDSGYEAIYWPYDWDDSSTTNTTVINRSHTYGSSGSYDIVLGSIDSQGHYEDTTDVAVVAIGSTGTGGGGGGGGGGAGGDAEPEQSSCCSSVAVVTIPLTCLGIVMVRRSKTGKV